MGKLDIKAPENLKTRTFHLMEEELNSPKPLMSKKLKSFISVAAMVVIMLLTGFMYDYFSGTKGDVLAFTNTEYKGDGIVYIDVKNEADKDLQFKKAVLKTWKTDEEILYINEKGDKDLPVVNVDMPLIEAGQDGRIVIDLSSIDYKDLEKPINEGDGFVFVLTNSDFEHGRDWRTAIRFNNEIVETTVAHIVSDNDEDEAYKVEQARRSPEIADNTNMDFLQEIKEKHEIRPILAEMLVTQEYVDEKHPHTCIIGEKGDDIYAISKGVVKEQGCAEVKGNYIIIEHSEDFTSEYYHCSEILVEAGDEVAAGEVIAKVGSTGRATGNFLSLAVEYKGESFNPLHLFDEEDVTKLNK